MTLAANLPTDPLGYRFAGPAGWLPSGTRVGSTDYAYAHVQLYKADGTVLVGQQAMASSIPVALASDQSVVPISGTGIHVAATAVDSSSGTDDELVVGAAAGLRLMGFSCQEATGSATANFYLRNGTNNSGALLYAVTVAANESRGEWFGPAGIASASGIWIERVSGNVLVVTYYKAVA